MAQGTAKMTIQSSDEAAFQVLVFKRRDRFVRNIRVLTIVGATLNSLSSFAIWRFFPQYTQLLIHAGLTLATLIPLGPIHSLLHRRGHTTASMYVLLASVTAVVFIALSLIPETIAAAAIAYVFLTLLGSLSLGAQTGRRLVVVNSIGFGLNILLARSNLVTGFEPLDPTVGQILGALLGIIAVAAVAFSVTQVVGNQDDYFRQSTLSNWEIERRVAVEQAQRQRLQQASLEIEKRATAEQEQREHLQSILVQVRDAVGSLNSAAAEILAATIQQTAGANEQSVAIAQTTTTVDEVKVIAEQAVARAQEVADASQRSVEISHDGQWAVQNTINGMGRIKERVASIAENILSLSEQTQQIGDIIASVNDLAAQSNMLALNAAVEAARAGEHGKGFAVVAAEVRALAEQSKQATTQIKTILEDIQKATNSTVMATEEGTKGVDEGVSLAAQAQNAIAQLAGVIDTSAQAAAQMVADGRQQATGTEQIALAMSNINQATIQNLTSTHQAEKIAQALSELARSLAEIVEQYRV